MIEPLFPPIPLAIDERRVDLIVISGIGTLPPAKWLDESGQWLQQLHEDCDRRLQIWSYKYALKPTEASTLQQLLEEGDILLACLDDLCAKRNSKRRPVFFICHSLGGIILKKALCVIRDHLFKHLNVIDVISGIFFLGTPHLPLNIESEPNIVELILRANHKTALPKNALTSTGDNFLLAKLSHEFELVGIQVPVVSGYEKKESKVFKGIFAKYRKPRQVIIITKRLCTIGSSREHLVEVDCTHNEICKVVVNGPLYSSIRDSLISIINDAENLTTDMAHTSIPDGLEHGTLRSQSSRGPGSIIASRIQKRSDVNLPLRPQQTQQSPAQTGDATRGTSTDGSIEIVHLPTNFDAVKKNPRLPCFSVRTQEKNPIFFGRTKILGMMDNVLLPDSTTSTHSNQTSLRSFALCGMGGIGKTQVAAEYVYSRKSKFEAVFWVSADDRNILAEEFARIAVELELVEQTDAQELPIACELVKGWLSNPIRSQEAASDTGNEVSWLLVFDNVDDFDVLESFWPTTGLGAVLITSRDPLAKTQKFTTNHGVDLRPFSIPETAEFIKILTVKNPQAGQDKYLKDIADKLGGLPFLIPQMVGVMERLRLSYTEFLRLFEESGIHNVSRTGSSRSQSEQMFSVSSKLGLDGLTSKSLGLLQMISLLDPDRIPEKILESACSQTTVAEFPENLGEYYQARAQLLQSSLINRNPESGDVWLHRIVQDVAREGMGESRLARTFETALRAVSKAWPFRELVARFNTDRYKDCADIFPTVVRLKNAHESVFHAENCREIEASAALYNDAGWYWFERGFPEEANEFFKLIELLCEQSADTATAELTYQLRRANLNQGTACMETNNGKECLVRYKKWLEMSLATGSDSEDVKFGYELACIYNETGVAYAMNEMYDLAIDYFLQSIKSFQSLPNYDDTMLNWPEPNLGFMYWVQEKYVDADRVLTEILEIHQVAYGFDAEKQLDDTVSFKTGKILYALGNVYVSQGLFDKGFIFHTRCLKQYRVTLGESHHRVGDVCHRLADHNIRYQKFDEAHKLINKALKIFSSRTYYRNELARSTYKRGQIFQAMGEDVEAIKCFKDAFDIRRTLVTGDDRTLDNLLEADYDKLVIFWSR